MSVKINGGGQLTGLATSGIPSSDSVGFLQAGTGAVARTLQDKGRDFVSVKDFGAVGDGVADDTAAIDALKAAGHVPFIPAGSTCLVSYTSASDLFDVYGYGTITNGFITVNAADLVGDFDLEDQATTPTGPTIRRPATTTEHLDLYVDGSVSSSGNGSQAAPFKTINEALAFVPRAIYHRVRIYLADGVYAGAGNAWNLYNYFVTPRSDAGLQIIGHVPEHPLYADTNLAAVVLGDASGANTTSNFVIGGILGDPDDTKVVGVTIDGRVQVYGTPFCFDRVAFKTGRNGNLIDGHGGRVKFVACDFSNCANALEATDLAVFFVTACTGSNLSTSVAAVRNGSFVSFENSDALAFLKPIVQEGNSIVKVEGSYISTDNGGTQTWGVKLATNGAQLLRTNIKGDLVAKQALVGGSGVVTLPGNDTFALYMASNNLYLKVNAGGTEKLVKLYDFATNAVQ